MAHAGDGEDGRRKTLKKLVTGGTAVVAAGTALPPVRLLLAPVFDASGAKEKWTRVARLDDCGRQAQARGRRLRDDGRLDRYEHENLGAVWLLRDKDEVRAFSVTCPHLGCGIE